MLLPLRTVALFAGASLLAGACGSTAQIGGATPAVASGPVAEAGAAEDDEDFGLGLDTTPTGSESATSTTGDEGTAGSDLGDGAGATAGDGGGVGSTPSGSSRGGQGAGATTTSSGSGTNAGAGGGDRQTVAPGTLGVTDTQIHIGFTYFENASAANEAIGFEEFSAGDPRRNHQIMVEHINATGGIAGRELVPVFHVADGASNQTTAEREQQTCATWTQDNEVFAAVIAAATDTLRQCLANAGVALINSQGLGTSDDRTLADFPTTVEPTNLSLNPMARLTVTGLDAQDYFEPSGPTTPTRVGIITYDHPAFRRAVEGDMLPALDRLGLDVVDPIFVKYAERQSDAGEISAQLSNTVLRFRSQGVTHVLIFEANALLTVLFMTNAEPQGYRPRYGFNTQNGGQIIVGSVPEAQLVGTKQVGWLPMFDVLDVPEWPAQRACLDRYREAGVDFDSNNAKGVALVTCDLYEVLRDGIENAPGPLSLETLLQGVERLGTTYQSALVRDVRLEPGRRYGVSTYRFSEYATDCSCFRYTGGPFPID